jgi:predicted transcriptional regulator
MTMLHSYIDQLEELALKVELPLKRAFMLAGVPDSTFYRALHGQDLRLDTAQKIAAAIEQWDTNGSTGYKERAYSASLSRRTELLS